MEELVRCLRAAFAAQKGGGLRFDGAFWKLNVPLFARPGAARGAAAGAAEARLSGQETRLLALLAEGHGYQSAADALGISVNTVRKHIRNLYEKLEVHTRSEAVGKALRGGLI
jgi:DNA-binding CsgD family transcriptional regulator